MDNTSADGKVPLQEGISKGTAASVAGAPVIVG